MKTVAPLLLLAALGLHSAPAQEQEDPREALAELRKELVRTQDLLIEQAREFDRKTRKLQDELALARRRAADEARVAKQQGAQTQRELEHLKDLLGDAYALLEKHGIELPQPPRVKETLETKTVTTNFPKGMSLGEAVGFIAEITELQIEVRAGGAARLFADFRTEDVTLANVLSLLVDAVKAPEELGWALERERVIVIDLQRITKKMR